MAAIHDIPDEVLRRGDIACTILCQMDFATNPQNWWLGYGPLSVGDVTYQGTGDAIKISAMQLGYGTSAGMIRFTVDNASPQMLAASDNQEAEVNARRCQVFYQLFSTIESGDNHYGRLVGDPISMFVGQMKNMTTTSTAETRQIELECYGRMSSQGKPPFGRWTDGDQQARYPGDLGLSLLPTLVDKSVTWLRA